MPAPSISASRDKSHITRALVTAASVPGLRLAGDGNLCSAQLWGRRKQQSESQLRPHPPRWSRAFFLPLPLPEALLLSHSDVTGCGTAGNYPSPGHAGYRLCQGGRVIKARQLSCFPGSYICAHPIQLTTHLAFWTTGNLPGGYSNF